MTRLSALIPPEMPFEASYSEADGKVLRFEIHPGFLADVIRRAGISPSKLQGVPLLLVSSSIREWITYALC